MGTIGGLMLLGAMLVSNGGAEGPQTITPDLAGLAQGTGRRVFNRTVTVTKENGRAVARLDARPGDGGVLLDGLLLSEGTIDVDLKGRNVPQQSFLGIAFHVVDWTTLEAVYFRPFNFRSPDPERRARAVQYVAHPDHTWQRLRAERPGQFEQGLDPAPDPDGWFHARIVLAGGRVDVYVDGAVKPSLSVGGLGEAKSGGVALFVGNGSDGAFADLRVTATATAGPPPPSRQNVFQAASTGNLARLRALVDADPSLVSARGPSDFTPLHAAALYGQSATAGLLLEKGADANAVARHAGTPLDVADEAGQAEMAAWLTSRGASFTPLRFDVAALSPSIHRVAFPWGMRNNVVVLSSAEGALVVDTGFSTRAVPALKALVASWSTAGVRYVVNTHAHGDHVAGNALAPSPGAVVTAAALGGASGLEVARDPEPLRGRSGRTLPAPWTLRVGRREIKLLPRPGLHSDADLMVYFPSESVVAMGDLLLSESVPATADLRGYLAFLDDVLDVFPEGTTFVSGHGRDLDAAGLRAYRADLVAMIDLVRASLAAGRTAEQMVQDDVLAAYEARYSLLAFLTPDALIPRAVAALREGSLK
jgi:glyoxylase-like metal-dependent hydrolase (beta-lactamase superfamily II)